VGSMVELDLIYSDCVSSTGMVACLPVCRVRVPSINDVEPEVVERWEPEAKAPEHVQRCAEKHSLWPCEPS
jgi:hypothetical protein